MARGVNRFRRSPLDLVACVRRSTTTAFQPEIDAPCIKYLAVALVVCGDPLSYRLAGELCAVINGLQAPLLLRLFVLNQPLPSSTMAAETATERDFRRRRIFRLGLSRACHRLTGSNLSVSWCLSVSLPRQFPVRLAPVRFAGDFDLEPARQPSSFGTSPAICT